MVYSAVPQTIASYIANCNIGDIIHCATNHNIEQRSLYIFKLLKKQKDSFISKYYLTINKTDVDVWADEEPVETMYTEIDIPIERCVVKVITEEELNELLTLYGI